MTFTKRLSPYRGHVAVFGGFLIHLTLGTLYSFGNLNPYFVSYFYYRDTESQASQTIWMFAMTISFMGALGMFSGYFKTKMGTRIGTLVFSWLMSAGVFLTYFAMKVNLALTVLTYGVILGTGTGIAYSISIAAAMAWFPNRRAMVSGIVCAGFGGGAFIFNYVQTFYINPDNLSPIAINGTNTGDKYFVDEDLLNRVPNCFLLLGGIYSSMQLIGVLCLGDPPENNLEIEIKDEETKLIDLKENDSYSVETTTETLPKKPLSAIEVVKTREFWILFLTFLFNTLANAFLTTLYKNFGQTFISDDHFLTTVGSVAAIVNSLGRIVWGGLNDKISYKILMCVQSVSLATFLGTFYLMIYLPKQVYFFWVCALLCSSSGIFALFPPISSKTFGTANLATNYGMITASNAISGLVSALLLTSLESAIGYLGVFCIASGSALISLLLTLIFTGRVYT